MIFCHGSLSRLIKQGLKFGIYFPALTSFPLIAMELLTPALYYSLARPEQLWGAAYVSITHGVELHSVILDWPQSLNQADPLDHLDTVRKIARGLPWQSKHPKTHLWVTVHFFPHRPFLLELGLWVDMIPENILESNDSCKFPLFFCRRSATPKLEGCLVCPRNGVT